MGLHLQCSALSFPPPSAVSCDCSFPRLPQMQALMASLRTSDSVKLSCIKVVEILLCYIIFDSHQTGGLDDVRPIVFRCMNEKNTVMSGWTAWSCQGLGNYMYFSMPPHSKWAVNYCSESADPLRILMSPGVGLHPKSFFFMFGERRRIGALPEFHSHRVPSFLMRNTFIFFLLFCFLNWPKVAHCQFCLWQWIVYLLCFKNSIYIQIIYSYISE